MRFLLPYNTRSLPVSFYSDFHQGLAEAAYELGHDTLRFDIADGARASAAEREALYRALAATPCDTVIDLCCWGLGLSHITVWDGSPKGEPLFDSLDMAYFGLLLDQPWFQPLPGVRSAQLYAGVPDRNNAAQIALIYPDLRLRALAFTPPAVRAANDRSRPWGERDIDVLFIAHLQNKALARAWPAGCAVLCEATAERALAAPAQPLHEVLLDAAKDTHHPRDGSTAYVDAATAAEVLRSVEPFLRAHYRLQAVRAAAACGAAVHVAGSGWENVELPPSVMRHAATDYEGLFTMAGRARICLDVSTYPGGANDRVFSYSINRAVCLTNASGYLGEVYGASGGMQFYSPTSLEQLGAAIAALLAAPQRLRDRGEAGREITLATQNWRVRLQAILECITPHRGE